MLRPSDYPIHPHRGQRFYVAQYDARKWCVCGGNGELLATCCTEGHAEMIVGALHEAAEAGHVAASSRASEAATLNARIADVHRAKETTRLQRLSET